MNIFEIQAWLVQFGRDIKVDGIRGPVTNRAIATTLRTYKCDYSRIKGDTAVAFEQLVMREVGGLAVGPIDGIVGPATRKARLHWRRGAWRNVLTDAAITCAAPKNKWPTYDKLEEFFGEPGTNQTMFHLPFPMKLAWDQGTEIHRFSCNKKVVDSLGRVYKQILADYGHEGIQEHRLDLFGGCLNVRSMRGSSRLSTHAYGIAIDTDPARNWLRASKKQATLARPVYDKFWKAWETEGWVSLGRTYDYDWMHVQACDIKRS